jgi:hypothetical protein
VVRVCGAGSVQTMTSMCTRPSPSAGWICGVDAVSGRRRNCDAVRRTVLPSSGQPPLSTCSHGPTPSPVAGSSSRRNSGSSALDPSSHTRLTVPPSTPSTHIAAEVARSSSEPQNVGAILWKAYRGPLPPRESPCSSVRCASTFTAPGPVQAPMPSAPGSGLAVVGGARTATAVSASRTAARRVGITRYRRSWRRPAPSRLHRSRRR